MPLAAKRLAGRCEAPRIRHLPAAHGYAGLVTVKYLGMLRMRYDPIVEQAHHYYEPGVPYEIPIAKESLFKLLEGTASRYPNVLAIDYFGATTTYAEVLSQTERAAQVLVNLGVERGDTVALALPNCPQAFVAFYACQRIGAIAASGEAAYVSCPRTQRPNRASRGEGGDRVGANLREAPQGRLFTLGDDTVRRYFCGNAPERTVHALPTRESGPQTAGETEGRSARMGDLLG